MPTQVSPLRSLMPRTPWASRPLARTVAWRKRTACPRDDDDFLRPAVLFQRRLFDQALARGHDQKVAPLREITHRQAFGDFLSLREVEQIYDCPPAAIALELGQIIDFLPIDLAAIGEKE